MRLRSIIVFIIYILCSVFKVNGQIVGNEISVIVSPDHTDWTYKLKEKSTFTIMVFNAQNLLKDVKIVYELGTY